VIQFACRGGERFITEIWYEPERKHHGLEHPGN